MPHYASRQFWAQYQTLPEEVRSLADKCYALLEEKPRHPSLQFKKVGRFWSARIGLDYRALAIEVDDGLVWIWIGLHDEYERLIQS
jgi:hypothetical protein